MKSYLTLLVHHSYTGQTQVSYSTVRIERLGYPVSNNGKGIGDDDVTIECVDVIVSHIARVCAVLVTRHKLAVSLKYRTP